MYNFFGIVAGIKVNKYFTITDCNLQKLLSKEDNV